MAHRLAHSGPPQNETAAQAGNRGGGKSKEKACKNLQGLDYLSARLDAIAARVDPTVFAEKDAIAALIDLADAALLDPDLEDDGREPDENEPRNVPTHLSGGNGHVPTRDENERIAEAAAARVEEHRRQWMGRQ